MIIVDAGAIVELIVGSLDPDQLGDEELGVPHLLDSEVINVLRRLVAGGVLSDQQGSIAFDAFTRLYLRRFPADWLRSRMWQLRSNLSAYDATYVALAELTDATELLTTDTRLARAPGIQCKVRVL